MRELIFRLLLSIASVTLCTTAPAFASERTPDARAQQFEHGLLPRVAFKEQLGRTAKLRTWRVPENELTKQDKVTLRHGLGPVIFRRLR